MRLEISVRHLYPAWVCASAQGFPQPRSLQPGERLGTQGRRRPRSVSQIRERRVEQGQPPAILEDWPLRHWSWTATGTPY